MKGIIQITGEPGVGKTSMALGAKVESAKDIAVYNFDVKPYPVIDKNDEYNGYGFYRQYTNMLRDLSNPNPELALVEQVIADFDKADSCKTAIFDSWEIFSKGLLTWTLKHASELKSWIGAGQIAQMAKLGHASRVEVAFLDYLYTVLGVESLFVINHLGHEYSNNGGVGVRTGRRIPQSSERLNEKCSARFWLKHNPDHTCPIAVVLKDPGSHRFVPGRGVVPSRVFPDRLSPMALGDVAGKNVTIWDIIDHYNENPVGARKLEPFEHLTADEFAYVSGTMTETQRRVAQRNQELALSLGSQMDYDVMDTVTAFKEQGKTFMETYQELKESGAEVTLIAVKKMYDSVEV